jgi:hypothetical protein
MLAQAQVEVNSAASWGYPYLDLRQARRGRVAVVINHKIMFQARRAVCGVSVGTPPSATYLKVLTYYPVKLLLAIAALATPRRGFVFSSKLLLGNTFPSNPIQHTADGSSSI